VPSFIVADRLALIARQRMGARMAATGLVRAACAGRRNRSWPEALKREIVAASYAKGSTVGSVAERYSVAANQIYLWRRRLGAGVRTGAPGRGPTLLVPVTVAHDDHVDGADCGPTGSQTIELVVDADGTTRVRVGARFDADTLRRVLGVLRSR
jgi:transposase